MKFSTGNFLNSTNNHLECINAKLKSVISRHSLLEDFIENFFLVLRSMHTERNHKAALISQKVPVFITLQSMRLQLKFLMPYAFKYVHQHLDASSKVQMEATTEAESFVCTYHGHTITATPNSCSCYFRQSLRLPCKHMFAIRVQLGFPIFHESLCD